MTTLKASSASGPAPLALDVNTPVLHGWSDKALHWVSHEFFSVDTGVQLGIVLGCIILGWAAGRLLGPGLLRMVGAWHLPARLDSLLRKACGLVGALLALVFLLVAGHIVAGLKLHFGHGYIDAAMRLAIAWILIRLAVHGIRNNFMRKLIGGFVLLVAALSISGTLDGAVAMLDGLGVTLGGFHISALSLIKAFFATVVMIYAASAVAEITEKRLERMHTMATGPRLLIAKTVRGVFITLAVLVGLTMAGVNLSMLAVFSGAVGLGIGLGLQKSVSNLLTGITLLLDRTIQPGDILELPDGVYGSVRRMGSRCVEIVTLDERSYLIPNEYLVANQVINWSRSGRRLQLSVPFAVGYDQNPEGIMALAAEAAKKTPRVLQSPAPSCSITAINDGKLDITLCFWIEDAHNGTGGVKGSVLLNIWTALKAHNVTIPHAPKTIYNPAEEIPAKA